ncbi:MAG: hypothetical protein F6K14_31735 [Symploca sp. SIO2C1]|nr:hypothetical protein [Symploca sp. SIO2C1]
MSLLTPTTRDTLSPEIQQIWDACEENYPQFKNLWSTMANSPIILSHVWGQLLTIKKQSPVAAKHYEIAIVVASNLMTCEYCVSHHSPRAAAQGYSPEQLEVLDNIRLTDGPAWKYNSLFDDTDNLVIDLAYHLVWSGTYAKAHQVPQRIIYEHRQRIFKALEEKFNKQQIEELVWRTTQCVAFNWHNDFFEIDLETNIK